MSIVKRNIITNINRLISDDILREQMIDLHLGKLTPDDIRKIREEREREAEEILKIPQDYAPNECIIESKTIVNGQTEN